FDYWKVWSRDGRVSFYGVSPESAAQSDAEASVVRDPSSPTNIFAWKLTLTLDPFGNRIEYGYRRDAGDVDGHRWEASYLSEIRYVNYSDGKDTRFLVHVFFDYEDRPDPFSSYRAGFEQRTTRRCVAVRVATDPGQLTPVRTTHFHYSPLPQNGASLL